MTSEPSGVLPKEVSGERAAAIRDAVEREFGPIARAVAAMVRSDGRGRDREWLRQRAEEVLSEAISRALERPESYDPGRPAAGWIVGIARNVMRNEDRVAAARPRVADLDEAAWASALGVIDPGSRKASDHLDVEVMLSRLSPPHRLAIELRYLRGLVDEELVPALGVRTAVAARQRVYRAVQALRDLYAPCGPEVDR